MSIRLRVAVIMPETAKRRTAAASTAPPTAATFTERVYRAVAAAPVCAWSETALTSEGSSSGPTSRNSEGQGQVRPRAIEVVVKIDQDIRQIVFLDPEPRVVETAADPEIAGEVVVQMCVPLKDRSGIGMNGREDAVENDPSGEAIREGRLDHDPEHRDGRLDFRLLRRRRSDD